MVGTDPVWPPPSPPWAITASTPQSATFSAWRRAPTVGMVKSPASLQRATSAALGAWAKLATRAPVSIMSSIRSCTSATSVRRLTPKGCVVRPRTSAMAAASSSSVMVAEARMPSPPASLVAATRRGPATQPMPVCTRGWRTPTRSHSSVCSAGCSSGRRRRAGVARQVRTSRSRCAPGSRTRDELELLGRGQAGLGHVVGDGEREAGGGHDVLDADAGMVRAQAHGALRRLEVEDAEVGDDAPDVVEARRPGPGRGGPGVADAAHHVDLLHERAHGVVRHPVAGGVVDRVAGRAAHADELHLGPVVGPDGRDVLVAGAVDLARHHHDVAPARPHDVEHAAVGHGGLAHQRRRRGGEGRRADHERGLAVGEDELGGEGQLGQPGPEGGDGAERAGHDLTRPAPGVGAGDDAGLRPGDAGVAHRVAPPALPHADCRSAMRARYSSSSTRT